MRKTCTKFHTAFNSTSKQMFTVASIYNIIKFNKAFPFQFHLMSKFHHHKSTKTTNADKFERKASTYFTASLSRFCRIFACQDATRLPKTTSVCNHIKGIYWDYIVILASLHTHIILMYATSTNHPQDCLPPMIKTTMPNLSLLIFQFTSICVFVTCPFSKT